MRRRRGARSGQRGRAWAPPAPPMTTRALFSSAAENGDLAADFLLRSSSPLRREHFHEIVPKRPKRNQSGPDVEAPPSQKSRFCTGRACV
eukprot:4425107-Prymnesium_polylepis.1